MSTRSEPDRAALLLALGLTCAACSGSAVGPQPDSGMFDRPEAGRAQSAGGRDGEGGTAAATGGASGTAGDASAARDGGAAGGGGPAGAGGTAGAGGDSAIAGAVDGGSDAGAREVPIVGAPIPVPPPIPIEDVYDRGWSGPYRWADEDPALHYGVEPKVAVDSGGAAHVLFTYDRFVIGRLTAQGWQDALADAEATSRLQPTTLAIEMDAADRGFAFASTYTRLELFSHRAGAGWAPHPLPVAVDESAELNEYTNLRLAFGGDSAFAVWVSVQDGGRVRAARHDGIEWSDPIALDTLRNLQCPVLATDNAGQAIALWRAHDCTAERVGPCVKASYYDGAAWSPAAPLPTDEASCGGFHADITGPGQATALFVDNTQLFATHFRRDTGAWSEPEPVAQELFAASAPRFEVDSHGRGLAVWLALFVNGKLNIWARSFDVATLSWGELQAISHPTFRLSMDPALTMNAAGQAIAAWTALPSFDAGELLTHWAATYDPSSGWSEPIVLDSAMPQDWPGPSRTAVAINEAGAAAVTWAVYGPDSGSVGLSEEPIGIGAVLYSAP